MNFLFFAEVTQAQHTPPLLASPIILIPFIIAIFYFLVIKPQKKTQSEHQNMISNLKKNDEVITIGGIYGTVVNVKENSIILRVDDNVKIEFQKSAISTIKKAGS